jgi:cysteinyl-tRNA synthetase
MSKSLGNVFTVKDVVERGYRASTLRYLLMSVHYRKQLTFSWDILDQAEAAMTRLADFMARLATVSGSAAAEGLTPRLAQAESAFRAAMADDLNVPKALSVVFDLLREMNAAIDAGALGQADAEAVRTTFESFDNVLGVLALRRSEDEKPPVPVEEIERLIEERRTARASRQFARADEIRRDLDQRGIVLEDSPTGTRWKRK